MRRIELRVANGKDNSKVVQLVVDDGAKGLLVKQDYGGLQAKRLRELEQENAKLGAGS